MPQHTYLCDFLRLAATSRGRPNAAKTALLPLIYYPLQLPYEVRH